MSKPTSIATILDDLADGATINAFEGTLTKLYEVRTIGAGTDRAWTKQNGEMKDAAGKTIPVEFRRNGEEVPTSWKGKLLRFESVKGERGTSGVKVMDDTYNGKTTRKLCITGTAEMSFVDGSGGASKPASQGETWRPGEGDRKQEPAAPRQEAPHSDTIDTKALRKTILKRATIWLHCYDTAVAAAILVGKKHEFAMVPQAIGALTTTLYIDTLKELGPHGISKVDTREVDWSAAKGKTMKDMIAFLNEQVEATAAARMPKAPANTALPATGTDPDWPEAPPPSNTKQGSHPLDEDDEIPF